MCIVESRLHFIILQFPTQVLCAHADVHTQVQHAQCAHLLVRTLLALHSISSLLRIWGNFSLLTHGLPPTTTVVLPPATKILRTVWSVVPLSLFTSRFWSVHQRSASSAILCLVELTLVHCGHWAKKRPSSPLATSGWHRVSIGTHWWHSPHHPTHLHCLCNNLYQVVPGIADIVILWLHNPPSYPIALLVALPTCTWYCGYCDIAGICDFASISGA